MKLSGVPRLNGIPPEEFDYFHELIVHEEIARIGTPGTLARLQSYTQPPVLSSHTHQCTAGRVVFVPPV
jgi:hypothetical protein